MEANMPWDESRKIVEAVDKFNESSTELSKKMIDLAKSMKDLTICILILTIILVIMTGWQIYKAFFSRTSQSGF
jgi:hypothetical protein